MGLAEYKNSINLPLKEAVVSFVIDKEKILLIVRKSSFGGGIMSGVGGKREPGETLEEAAKREVYEETKDEDKGGIIITQLSKVAELEFYFPHKPSWSQQVTAFLIHEWTGEALESNEAIPVWSNQDQLPWGKMWHDNSLWLPQVLAGENVKGEFLIGEDLRVIEFVMKEADFRQNPP